MFNLRSSTWPKSQLRADWAYLENRIKLFLALPAAALEAKALGAKLREIGHAEGSTARRGDAA